MAGGVVNIIGMGISAYSAVQQGRSAAAQAKQQAAWDDYNAKVAKREADAERKASDFEATQQSRAAKQLLARQRALIGASGVTPEGSPLLLAEDTAEQLAIEGANIRTTGERRVGAWTSRSILDTAKARAARASAPGYQKAGYLRAGSSILQGASRYNYMRSQ
ncbi:unnamed protein product [marine sediment metagenome]|uniref:Uncharacterized protein n=1 Tax=marine sediment metagenome TaxID=412755 RepID=X0USJ5_9ZZZZ